MVNRDNGGEAVAEKGIIVGIYQTRIPEKHTKFSYTKLNKENC